MTQRPQKPILKDSFNRHAPNYKHFAQVFKKWVASVNSRKLQQ